MLVNDDTGSVTAQVTPTADCNGIFVASHTPSTRVVKELGVTSAATFDYVVFVVRAGTDFDGPMRDKVE